MNLTVGNLIMIGVAVFSSIWRSDTNFEPLLAPIAFGMLLVNIYPDIMLHAEDAANGTGGLLYYFLCSLTSGRSFLSDLPRSWSDDRLWSADREPESFRPVQQLSSVFSRLILELWLWDSQTRQRQLSPSSVARTARHLSSLQVNCSRRHTSTIRRSSILLYVTGADHPATDHETSDDGRKKHLDYQLRPVSEAGENPVPDYRNNRCMCDSADDSSTRWYVDAR